MGRVSEPWNAEMLIEGAGNKRHGYHHSLPLKPDIFQVFPPVTAETKSLVVLIP